MTPRAWAIPLFLAMCKAPDGVLEAHVHPTTHLALLVPSSVRVGNSEFPLAVTQSATGFRLTSNAFTRHQVSLTADVDRDAAPAGPWPNIRRFGGRLIYSRVDESEAGMGGEDYSLVAWESCDRGRVVYRQSDTVEAPAQPDFSLAWTVIEHARVP